MNHDTIGVDVSKDHLDAHRLTDCAAPRFANDKRGHKALIKWLMETPTTGSSSSRPGLIIAHRTRARRRWRSVRQGQSASGPPLR